MERFEEDIFSSDGTVVSKFRLTGDGRSLSDLTSHEYEERAYSTPCGYGYRFGLQWTRTGFTRQPWIYMDAYGVSHKLGQLTVTISAESSLGSPPLFMPDAGRSLSGGGYAVSQSCISKTVILRTPFAISHLATMNVLGTNLSRVTLSFKVVPQHPSQHRAVDFEAAMTTRVSTSLRNSLQTSLDDGRFIDTKLYGFSCRSASGQVSRPLPIFTNSIALKSKSTYFDTMFSRSYFAESSVDELARGAPQEGEIHCSAEEYDYDSDSDLELIDDDPDSGDAAPMPSGSVEGRGLGRTVYIKDIAHKTLKSFAWYCYSGELIFAPFKSDTQGRKVSEPIEEPLAASKPPSCSPKSMYRLADKYGITELEDRTFEEIRDRLTVHNILDELFSTFTSRYDRVRQMEIDFICEKLDCPEISEGLPRVVAGFATDTSRQPNFTVLSSLIQKLMERRSVPHYSRRGTNGLIMDDVYIPGERNERKVPADLFAF